MRYALSFLLPPSLPPFLTLSFSLSLSLSLLRNGIHYRRPLIASSGEFAKYGYRGAHLCRVLTTAYA